MKRFLAIVALFAALAALTGCGTMEKTWVSTKQTTQKYYKEYLDTDPTIDYEAHDWTSSEAKLADLITPVDNPIHHLSIALNRQDAFPEDAWVDAVFAAHPWISGLEAITLDGKVVLQRPETTLKPLNLAPALAHGEALADRKLRTYVDTTPLGPEVYLATGMFRGNELVGAVVVHFDIRNVVNFCPQPESLVMATPGQTLWSGSDAAAAAVAAQPWAELLVERSSGRFEADGQRYIWLCRSLGDAKILYATTALEDDAAEEDSGFSFFGLF